MLFFAPFSPMSVFTLKTRTFPFVSIDATISGSVTFGIWTS